MAKNHDLIPVKDSDFDVFFNEMLMYCVKKIKPGENGAPAEWTHIPQSEIDEFTKVCSAWGNAWHKTEVPHTPVETVAKNEARKNAEKYLRPFIQHYLVTAKQVTDEDLVAMKLKPRDKTPTPTPDLSTFVPTTEGRIFANQHGFVEVCHHGARPYGAERIELRFFVGDKEAETFEELTQSDSFTGRKWERTFPDTDTGKKFSWSARYLARGGAKNSNWSDIQWLVIP